MNECLGTPKVMSLGLVTLPNAHDSCLLGVPVCYGSRYHCVKVVEFRRCEIHPLASVASKEHGERVSGSSKNNANINLGS